MAQRIVYTDLDGTLLDFTTYSYAITAPTVGKLQKEGIPLVFCSSKTRLEQEVYLKALEVHHPFIVENGSAILVPKHYFSFDLQSIAPAYGIALHELEDYHAILLGKPADYIRESIQHARSSCGVDVKGYADLSLSEIMLLTGLGKEAAQKAASRDFSETLLSGVDATTENWQQFNQMLYEKELQCVSGGKFHTIMGIASDKGKAITLLNLLFQQQYGSIETIGLGDSANDLPLLQTVDRAFLVQKPNGQWQPISDCNIKKVWAIGPMGWKMAIESYFSF